MEASVSTIEVCLRENNTGRFPRGIAAMVRPFPPWLFMAATRWRPFPGKGRSSESRTTWRPEKKILKTPSANIFWKTEAWPRLPLLPDDKLAAAREKGEKMPSGRAFGRPARPGPRKTGFRNRAPARSPSQGGLHPEALHCPPFRPLEAWRICPARSPAFPSRSRKTNRPLFSRPAHPRNCLHGHAHARKAHSGAVLFTHAAAFCRAFSSKPAPAKSDFASFGMRMAAKTGGIGAATTPWRNIFGPPGLLLAIHCRQGRLRQAGGLFQSCGRAFA